eukprot:9500526-Pyramimonas_sp.AAC.1
MGSNLIRQWNQSGRGTENADDARSLLGVTLLLHASLRCSPVAAKLSSRLMSRSAAWLSNYPLFVVWPLV